MNQGELIQKVADITGQTAVATEATIQAALLTIMNAVADGDKVKLVGFGGFYMAKRKKRVGRNPKTNEEVIIPARKVPAFKAGKDFKEWNK